MRRQTHLILSVAAVFSTACGDVAPLAAPNVPIGPDVSISQAGAGGNPHFYWLAPTVLAPTTYSGAFDPALAPSVIVCEWSGSKCGAVVAHFDKTGGTGGAALAVNASAPERYSVTWDTRRCDRGPLCPLDPAKSYRVLVLVSGYNATNLQLGSVDLAILRSPWELATFDRTQYAPVLQKGQFTIAFRVEVGIVTSVQVAPSSLAIEACQTAQLTATVSDIHGSPVLNPAVTWNSSNEPALSVNGSGLATAVGTGSATVTATSEAAVGNAAVTSVLTTPRIAYEHVPAGAGQPSQLAVMAACGAGRLTIIADPETAYYSPLWSPDGRTLAYEVDDLAGRQEIWSASALGTNRRSLTQGNGKDRYPVWSGNGAKIAFMREQGSSYATYVMNPDGSGQVSIASNATWPSISADGSQVLYQFFNSCQTVGIANADGSGARQLLPVSECGLWPQWSPDGTRFAFVRDQNLWIANADGSGAVAVSTGHLVDLGARPPYRWSPNGQRLAFREIESAGNPAGNVVVVDADGARQAEIPNSAGYGTPSWSPDGSAILFATGIRDPYRRIATARPDGTNLTYLTDGGLDGYPSWAH